MFLPFMCSSRHKCYQSPSPNHSLKQCILGSCHSGKRRPPQIPSEFDPLYSQSMSLVLSISDMGESFLQASLSVPFILTYMYLNYVPLLTFYSPGRTNIVPSPVSPSYIIQKPFNMIKSFLHLGIKYHDLNRFYIVNKPLALKYNLLGE